jgi:hypothetical protein
MAAKLPGGRIAIESEKDLKKHSVSILKGTVHMLEVRALGIETLKISGGGSEGLLVRLCAYSGPEEKPGPVKPRPGKRVPAGTAKAAKNSPAGKG